MDFINIHLIDILDIILVGLLIFQIYKLIRGTAAMSIFVGIIVLYFIWLIVKTLRMELLSAIMGQVLGVGVLAIIIIFQQEIRRFLIHLGNNSLNTGKKNTITRKLFGGRPRAVSLDTLEQLTQAVSKMSETKTGALIVMINRSSLEFVIETGDRIDANVNKRLIENIFFKNSPLHDGALIMSTTKLIAARCTLPITERQDIPPQYGMRHRAAIGISEQSDAAVIVVSEETGGISFIQDGELKTITSITELRIAIENCYSQ
ncbi:MAG: diadenylate cyclase CdaA [Bacteroidales bacterium]|nr:diadenylate cyclase CdaA [Bacteroidales bacterium]